MSALLSTSPTFWTEIHAELASAHNAFLQAVVEIGYLGAGIAVGLLTLALGRLAGPAASLRSRSAGSRVLVALIAFVTLAGCVESTWSPEYQELQALLLFALPAAAVNAAPGRGDPRASVVESGGA